MFSSHMGKGIGITLSYLLIFTFIKNNRQYTMDIHAHTCIGDFFITYCIPRPLPVPAIR